MRTATLISLVVLLLAAAPAAAHDGHFHLHGGERVVFFGDSITQSGGYVAYVEAYLRTRFPDRRWEVVNRGISSETLSGTSEPDHDPRRPCAHDRFARDVAAAEPDVLVACFGMNDGNYHPWDEERFAAYRAGVERLLDRARDEAGNPRVTLLTPPPFDPYYRRSSDPAAEAFGYKYAAIDYDDVMARYAHWLTTLRSDELTVADCHAPMNEHVRLRRNERVSFTLSPDAVHPDATGHWLMAQALLLAWEAPAEVDRAVLNARTLRTVEGQVEAPTRDGESIAFAWTTRLPLPLDPAWDARSIELEGVAARLNRLTLRVAGLEAGDYELLAADAPVGRWRHEQLAEGVNLSAAADFPPVARSREVLNLIQQRSQATYQAWRRTIAAPEDAEVQAAQREADELAATLDSQLRELCQPMRVELRLVKLP